jgi:hypothetical protein
MQDERLRPALREAALRQSSKTYVELLNFISEHGEYPRTQRLLRPDTGIARRATVTHQHGVH